MSSTVANAAPRPVSRDQVVLWGRRLLILTLILLWEAGARLFGNPKLVASPTAMIQALFTDVLSDPAIRNAIVVAVIEIVAAYALSLVVGLALGLAIGWTELGRRSLTPVIMLLYGIPQVILLPLFMLGFGIGPAAKIAFGFSHGVFPVLVNVLAGMRNVNPLYLRASRAMGARRLDTVRDVVFPHMVPSFFAGLRLAMTLTLLGVILAELYVSTAGVGYYTKLFSESFDPGPLFALVGVLTTLAIVLNETLRIAERRFTRWKR